MAPSALWFFAIFHVASSTAVDLQEEDNFDGQSNDIPIEKNLFSESGELCRGIPQIDSLSAPYNPQASPNCWIVRLAEQKRRMQPRYTYNTKREKFPNKECPKHLGSEYDFLDAYDYAITDFTAKTMGGRTLNVAAYDTAGQCNEEGGGFPNCCAFHGEGENIQDLCWQWPNDIPWDGTTLVDSTYTDQNPDHPVRINPGYAQNAGCKGGKGVIPGTDQTHCDLANDFYQLGCAKYNVQNNVTDCGLKSPATQYVYQVPPFSQGHGDGSEFQAPSRALGIYQADATYKDARLAPAGTKFGDGTSVDGKPLELDDYGWAFKNMHGKGYACLDARVKMLDACEEKSLNAKGIPTIPARSQIGMFAKDGGKGKQWPALVRSSGNRNHTVYDWHDVRVNGFGLKIYNAQDITGEHGENRIHFAGIPRSDYANDGEPAIGSQPPYFPSDIKDYKPYDLPDAKAGFKGDLITLQNLTTIDFLLIAVQGQFQKGCNENTAECLYNVFPAGETGRCFSPVIIYGEMPFDDCHYPPEDTHATWNPLNYTYGSCAAYALGNDGAFKLMVQPCDADTSDDGVNYWDKITNNVQDPGDPNYKANNLNDTLKNTGMQMCMYVQLQENPCEEPVEVATTQWKSEVRLAGRIHIDSGVVPRYNDVCDNTVFHPYRQLASHMPLGDLNRFRMAVYAYTQTFRLYRNHGQAKSPAEHFASKLPLQQPFSDKAPKTPPAMEPKCPLGF